MTPLMSTHHKHLEGGQKEWEYFEHELFVVHGVPKMKEAFGPPTSAVTTTPEPENGTFSCMRNDIRNDVVAERDSMSSYQRCMRPGNSMKCEADTHFLSHANSAVSHQTVDSPRGTHFVDETTSFSSRWCFDNGGPSLPRGLEYGDEIPSLSSQKCNGNVALSYSSQWEYGAEIPSLSSRQGYGAEIPSLSSTQSYGAEIPSLSSRQGYSAEIPLLSSRQGYGDEIPSLSRHWRYRDKLTLHSSRWRHDAEAHPLPSYQQGTYRNGHSRDKFVSSLVSNQQVKMITSKHTVARPRVPNRVVNSPDHYRINKKDNPWRNSEDIQDQVCGPRANKLNNSSTPSTEKDIMSPMVRRDQINRSDFSVQYEHAKFFIIKSYSEDDIHKGIKYNVWASTPNGNNKLDAAFHEAQILMKEKGTKCPVFLFFSVNTSGQFVGLAEMLGPVDFKKTMDFWQQDKWNGFFPVMWHIMKDIPNRLFKHITLENNNNRPVTFSRDTQEIGLPQGLEMLKIFKAYRHGTSILDDFNFYEVKENARCARKGTNADSIHEARHTFLGKEASLSDDFRSMENLEASMESMSFYETWD